MDPWAYHRDQYYSAKDAVHEASFANGWGAALKDHFVVMMALAQIDIAERAIASVATELNCNYHDGGDE